MPITSSAKKALRQSLKRKERNLKRKKAYKNALKKLMKMAISNKKEASDFLPQVYKTIDKAAKTNVIAKNKAARLKSKASRLVNNS
jgi:small subunit ribosomal protein S20